MDTGRETAMAARAQRELLARERRELEQQCARRLAVSRDRMRQSGELLVELGRRLEGGRYRT